MYFISCQGYSYRVWKKHKPVSDTDNFRSLNLVKANISYIKLHIKWYNFSYTDSTMSQPTRPNQATAKHPISASENLSLTFGVSCQCGWFHSSQHSHTKKGPASLPDSPWFPCEWTTKDFQNNQLQIKVKLWSLKRNLTSGIAKVKAELSEY